MSKSTTGGITSEILLAVFVGIIAVCIASLLLSKVFFRSLQSSPSSKVQETVTQSPVKAKPEERTLAKAAVSNNVEVDREKEKAEREKAEREKAEKEKADKEKAEKEQAQKEKEARQLLMEQARQTFVQKDDPQFKSDEDLHKIANTIAYFSLKCPTILECKELVQLCKKLEEKQYDTTVLTALKGSEYIFQQEIDMANAGYHKWGKVWVDDKQYAQLRKAASGQQQTQPTTAGPFPITVSHVRGYKVVIGKTVVNNGASGSGGAVVYRFRNDLNRSTVLGATPAGPTVAPVFGYEISYTLSNPTQSSQVAVVSLSMDPDADSRTYNLAPGQTLIGDFPSRSNARNKLIVTVNGNSQLFFIPWSNTPP